MVTYPIRYSSAKQQTWVIWQLSWLSRIRERVNLKCQQQQECFSAIETVHRVCHKEVDDLRVVAIHPERLPKVIELAMDVVTYCD